MIQSLKTSFVKLKSITKKNVDNSYDFAVKNSHRIIARKIGENNAFYTSNCHHPDVEEFIRAKQIPGRLTKFNISVVLSNKFMKAVIDDDFFEQTFNGKVYKKVKAKELYDLIMQSTYKRNEPGVLFEDNMQKNNPLSYLGRIKCANPCIIGSSILAVADGRNGVSIEQLANEKKDVPVYSRNLKNGIIEIKMGRNPRKTGKKREVWKLILDDGSFFIATPDHEFNLRNRSKVKLRDLKEGDSFFPFNSYESNRYRQISQSSLKTKGTLHLSRRQYRLIYHFYNPEVVLEKDDRIHHASYCKTDDRPEFLQKCSKEEHKKFHDISGKNNPIFKLKDPIAYSKKMSQSTSGLKNPRAFEITTQEILNRLIFFTKELGRRPSPTEIFNFCKNAEDMPTYLQEFRLKELNCKKFKEIPMLLEEKAFSNHTVKSVEFYGFEDVYNITVDDNHNYVVLTSWKDEKFITSSGICVKNCGEIGGLDTITTVCLLGSINLTQYISINVEGETVFDFSQYEEDIKVFTRMLDNVNDLATNPLPAYTWVVKNIRQIGIGINGLGSALIMLGIPYNSKEAVEFTKKICQVKEDITWQASALLAKEKGAFPVYNKDKFILTEYFQSERISEETKRLIKKFGVRNGKTTANPPLGNTSICCDNVSNGIEPIFELEYERTIICKWPEGLTSDNVTEVLKHYKQKDFEFWRGDYNGITYYYEPQNRGLCKLDIVRDYGYQWVLANQHLLKRKDFSKCFISTKSLTIEDHLAIQEVVQFYNNQSVSKTCNLPKNYTFENFKDLYLKAWQKGLNGFTTYREGTMESVLSTSFDMPKEIIKKDIKLPEEFLNGPTSIIKREGIKFYIHFSYLPEDTFFKFPIVMWIYTNSKEKSDSTVCNKAARELTKLAMKCGVEKTIIQSTLEKIKFEYPYNRLGRMISLCLRHNILREDILVSLMGIEGDNISSLLTAVRQFISKTIKSGTQLKGLTCQVCKGQNIIIEGGCKKCRDCGDSSCG